MIRNTVIALSGRESEEDDSNSSKITGALSIVLGIITMVTGCMGLLAAIKQTKCFIFIVSYLCLPHSLPLFLLS